MSFILETTFANDKSGMPLASHIGPFLFKKDADEWAETNIDEGGYWETREVVDPRSLRRF